jgi:hypothetical protein
MEHSTDTTKTGMWHSVVKASKALHFPKWARECVSSDGMLSGGGSLTSIADCVARCEWRGSLGLSGIGSDRHDCNWAVGAGLVMQTSRGMPSLFPYGMVI